MKRVAIVLAFSFTCLAGRAEELRMTTLFRGGDMTGNAGKAGIIVRDVVGDARPEIVTCASGSAFALSFDGTAYRPVWYSPDVGCTAVTVADLDGDGAAEVIVGADETNGNGQHRGSIYVFDPTCNRLPMASAQVSASAGVTGVAVGNVDNDTALEIVASTSANTYILDAATLAVQWNAPWGGNSVAIGDVEGDGLADVIVNGGDGHVLNAAAQLYKWGYAGGFGMQMAVGDLNGDGKAEIVGGTNSQLRIVHGDTFTVNTYAIEAGNSVGIGDANGDGQPEIVVTSYYSYNIRGYSPAGTLLWTISDNQVANAGVTAVGDPDGDGVTEVVWSDIYNGGLVVGRAGVNTPEWRGNNLGGYNFVVAAGDLDGDGDTELVIGGSSNISVRDLRTGATLGTLTLPGYSNTVYRLAIGQADADPQREIIVLASNYSGASLYVYDGLTYALEWQSDPVFSSNVLAVRNLDADPVDEIVVASYNTPKLQVLNGSGGFIQQNGPTLDAYPSDVAIGDLDSDGILDLAVGTGSSLYVYKTSDWSERKHITSPNYSYGAPRVAITAGQLAAFWSYENKLRTYDGTTLNELRACSPTSSVGDIAYAIFGGRIRLVAAEQDKLRLYPVDGAICPVADTASALKSPFPIDFVDVTGDGRPEIIAGGYRSYTVASLGWSDELHGDVDSDGVSTDADIDALASYLYGAGTRFHPAADVNGDTVIRADDLFYLINYRRGTGPPPP
jgi:hypothetical protein